MAIHVLDKHTAELIAAGEVVERPASVIKELLENAIDAGARQVAVTIQRGGIDMLQVQDDGSGIDAADIPLAFVRHATSKVRTKEDLDAIGTLGFRGEALASIASVARVELLTCTAADEYASLYRIEGGEELGIEAAARPVGTTITVRDLFYNTPARMKFLKKDSSEAGYVTETVTRLALSHPEVAVRYTREGKQVFATPGDGELQSAAYAVLGAEFARDLIEAAGGVRQYSVRGYITPPRAARASRAMQFFFINGRFVKNRTMMAALEQAYRGMLMGGRFPGCLLALTMPPELVDVNVHPAKTEVRFAREKEVFDVVYQTVKAALLHNAAAGHSQFEMKAEPLAAPETVQTAPEAQGQGGKPTPFAVPASPQPARPAATQVNSYNGTMETLASEPNLAPYETRPKPPVPDFVRDTVPPQPERGLDIEPEAELPFTYTPAQPQPVASAEPLAAPAVPVEQTSFTPPPAAESPLRLVGEVFKTYILAEANGVLCVIDKHAAHERIIYERLLAEKQEAQVQRLLVPVHVTLSAAEKAAVLENAPALEAAGLEADDFGGNEVLVRGVPADVEPSSVEDLLVEVAHRLTLNGKDSLNEKTEWVLHSVSCRAAVKAGDKTHPEELLRLAADILQGSIPPFCPHGRPVVLEISRKELEKQFGRLG